MNRIKRRRFKKTLVENKMKIILILTLSLIFLITGAYAILSVLHSINGKATIEEVKEKCDYDIKSEVKVTNSWPGGEILSITITNNSDEDINGFIIKLKGPSDLQVMGHVDLNGKEYVTPDENGVVTLKSLTYDDGSPYWNAVVKAHDSYTLQFQFASVEISDSSPLYPEWMTYNGCKIYGTGSIEPEDPDIELKSLEIDPKESNLKVGDTLNLAVIKSPSNASANLVWKSSDESIITVTQAGIVTALKEGNATVTVSSGSISASASIIVSKKDDVSTDSPKVTFEKTGYWGSDVIQFKITIDNNTNNTINKCSFDIGFPENTTYTIWSAASVTGNKMTYSSAIVPSGSVTIYGQVTIPSGYNAGDYLSPAITNIKYE